MKDKNVEKILFSQGVLFVEQTAKGEFARRLRAAEPELDQAQLSSSLAKFVLSPP